MRLVLLSLIVTATPAAAYTCATAGDDGLALGWATRDQQYVLDITGTADISGEDELDTLRQAFAIWDAISCSDLSWHEDLDTLFDGKVGFDYLEPASNVNSLTFHDSNWPHSSLTIALTTLTFSTCSGELLDADVEFNSQHFRFTTGNTGVITDLLNTAVHELGHMHGLDHSDDPTATMFPYAATGELVRRDLAPDDIDGLCLRYPTGAPSGFCPAGSACPTRCRGPGTCSGASELSAGPPGGCSTTGRDAAGLPPLLMALTFVSLLRRRP